MMRRGEGGGGGGWGILYLSTITTGGYDAGIPTIYTYLKSTIPLLPVGAVQLTDRLDRVFMRL